MSYHFGNPHLDEIISGIPPELAAGIVIEGPWGKTPPPTAITDTQSKNMPPSILASILANLPKISAGLGGAGLMAYSPPVGEGSDFGYSSNLKGQDLEGRKLYPMPKRNIGPKPSTRYTYGGGGKPTKKKSSWQKSQERRAAKRAEEEEEREKRRQQMNQSLQNYYSRVIRPNNIPPDVWEAYVPDEGMSNYSIFDASGGFKGLDVDALIDAIGIPTGKKVNPLLGREF